MLILWFILLIPVSWSQAEGLCEVLQLKDCRSVAKQSRRASAQSLPSPIVAASINPANVSQDKGLGLETIYHPNNPLAFSLVTGTGKIGGAIISSTVENSFFGNRVPEIGIEEIERRVADKRYESKKINTGFSFALFKNRKFGADLGIMAKYNQDTKRLSPGGGLSFRAGPINLGASLYKDDFRLKFKDLINPSGVPYSTIYGAETYDESFTVTNVTGGFRFRNFFFDVGMIQTKYKFENNEPSKIMIFSGAFTWDRFLFNLALRKETSAAPQFNYSEDVLEPKKDKSAVFGGVQYALNRFIILGVQYNYFLMKDVSFTGTVFF